MAGLPFRIDPDLTVRLGAEALRLTPSQGLRLAKALIRKSTRAMMVEEALPPTLRRPRPAVRRRAAVN